jgi:hypothetical protein
MMRPQNHNDYPVHSTIECIDAYAFPNDTSEWLPCARCGLRPKVWRYDNGLQTACGCWNSMYDHWDIRAESVMSCAKNGIQYNHDALRENWNHYVTTGEVKFIPRLLPDGKGHW